MWCFERFRELKEEEEDWDLGTIKVLKPFMLSSGRVLPSESCGQDNEFVLNKEQEI